MAKRIKRKGSVLKYRKSERHLSVDFFAFQQVVFDDVCVKYTDLQPFLLNVICSGSVIMNDNAGYFTKYDLMRYTGSSYYSCHRHLDKLLSGGYVEHMNVASRKFARRYRITTKGSNVLMYMNKCLLYLIDSREFYVSRSGRSRSVLFLGALKEGYYGGIDDKKK